MIESDADRLASIKALGGLRALIDTGDIWGIFDNAAARTSFDDSVTVTAGPQFECRSSDVSVLKIQKGTTLTIEKMDYRVLRSLPDGTGMTILLLEVA